MALIEQYQLRRYEIRKRRHKQIIVLITAILAVAAIFVVYFTVNLILHKSYTSYEVIHKQERKDSSSAKYERYGSGIIRYSRDGAMAMDSAGNLLWNGTFEMNDPILDVQGKYAVVSDRGSTTLEIFNGEGKMTTVNVANPIIKSEIASQGVVAVLMDGDGVNYISLYSEEGEKLVDSRTVNEKDGFPLDMSLSEDGRKLVTSYLTIGDGKVQSVITFFNFGDVGQNYVDKKVGGAFNFGQAIVPRIEFVNNNTVCAFGDNGFRIYSIEQTPKEIYKETFQSEIKSIFYSDKYVGFVLNNGEGANKYHLLLYDLNGKVVLDKGINYEYDNVFISGEEIILYSNLEWIIVRTNGQIKFHYTFDTEISFILPVNNIDKYIIIDNENMEEVKLTEKSK